MSKFFRSPESSDSESSETEEDIIQLDNLNTNSGRSNEPLDSISEASRIPTTIAPTSGQDWLLHALLEERCLNQVRNELQNNRHKPSERDIRRESGRRYQMLVQRLASLNLVSEGLEDSQQTAARQSIRDRLDSLNLESLARSPGLQAWNSSSQLQAAIPLPLQRLLTMSRNMDNASPTAILDNVCGPAIVPLPARYSTDFEELGLLGRGGYGKVFHVKHRLDERMYAVKKVPLRSATLARIQAKGAAAMEEILAEVRSLSRLDHPNVVRYYSSWIEWANKSSTLGSSSEIHRDDLKTSTGVVVGAQETDSMASLGRIRTESDAKEDLEVVFASGSTSQLQSPRCPPLMEATESQGCTRSNGALLHASVPNTPLLALHLQMDIYPMTLADFISPKANDLNIAPLSHCFHFEMSLHIFLAILEGVEYLHSEKIVHRDLKPANIFLRHEPNSRAACGLVDLSTCSSCREAQPAQLSVRIGDFGLAANIAQTVEPLESEAVGTEIYQPLTPISTVSPILDIFALGVIACELFWRFNTQMERRQTLQRLRMGKFPDVRLTTDCTAAQADQVRESIAAMLADQNITIAQVKQKMAKLLSRPERLLPKSSLERRVSA